MIIAVATYTNYSNFGTAAFPIYTAFKEFVDADGYDIETRSEVLYQGPSELKAIESCGETFGFNNRKFL